MGVLPSDKALVKTAIAKADNKEVSTYMALLENTVYRAGAGACYVGDDGLVVPCTLGPVIINKGIPSGAHDACHNSSADP